MKKIIKDFTRGLVIWSWIITVLFLAWIVYAATIPQVSNWDTLTHTIWNNLVDEVNSKALGDSVTWTEGVIYQAATDGFVAARSWWWWCGTAWRMIYIYSDSTSNPTTVVARDSNYGMMFYAVKKWDYYKVTADSTCVAYPIWIPFGT